MPLDATFDRGSTNIFAREESDEKEDHFRKTRYQTQSLIEKMNKVISNPIDTKEHKKRHQGTKNLKLSTIAKKNP